MSEARIQSAIMARLGARPDMRIYRQNSGKAIPVESLRRALRAEGFDAEWIARLMLRLPWHAYGTPGCADITGVLLGGRRLELEVKTDRGRLSTQQKTFHRIWGGMGALCIVARSPDEAERLIDMALEG